LVIAVIATFTLALAAAGDTITVASDVLRRRLAFLFVIDGIVVHGLAFVEGFEALLVNSREMDEDVLRAIVRGDESESLVGKEFDGALKGHVGSLVLVCCLNIFPEIG